MMRIVLLCLLLAIPLFSAAQSADSLTLVKQVDSLLRQLRPLVEQQKLDEASSVARLAQEKALKAFGKNHVMYANAVAFRGKIAQRKERFLEAEAWYLEAMAIQEKLFGKESPHYVISLSTLSTIYLAMGDIGKAEPLILETLALREKLVGRQHPDYARTLGTLGSFYYHKGYYGQAELQFLEAKSIFEKTLGKKHPEYSFILGNLASLYSETGNYGKVEPLLVEVCDILAGAYGKQSPFYVKALFHLAALYSRTGELAKAESQYLGILDLFSNGLSKERMDYALVLSSLAGIYLEENDLVKAEPMAIEAEASSARIFGTQHPDYAIAVKNAGLLYAAKGAYTKAEDLLLQAYEINKKALPAEHPNTAIIVGHLALLYQETNRKTEAGDRFLEATALNRINIENVAGYSSEAEMRLYLRNFQENTDQFYSFAQAHANPVVASASYDNTLFYKGFLLNGMMQVKNRIHTDSASTSRYGILRACRHQLSERYALPVAERDSQVVAYLEEQANTLEKELVRDLVGLGDAFRQVNWQEVQASLQPGEAAIEFIHFQYHNIQGKPTDSILYAALVLRPGRAAPEFVTLFEERALSSLLQGASGGNFRKINSLYTAGIKGQNTLHELIWQKLEPWLKGSTRVYCSLSGLLHRLNLGAIPLNTRETFTDRRQLVLLGSTRQLVVRDQNTVFKNEALLVGGVQYAENEAAISAANERLSRSRGLPDMESAVFEIDSLKRRDSWRFLPGTVTEVLDLRRILQSSEIQVKLDTGYTATEESIKDTGEPVDRLSPRILHFATHGYFFPDPENSRSSEGSREELAFKSSKNPLLRSGLILAGAQKTWSSGKPPADREDGVLTAQEISLLNLSGTELVVLSACETGLGDIAVNEGVYGLQRAFKIAGAKYIVMSLWKVNDQSTSEFMTDFYSQWLKKGLDIPEAFQNAQRTMRLRYPGEAYHWAGFELVE